MQLSRRQFSLIIFLSMIFLIVGFLVFNFFFNKGMITVTGQTPYTVIVKGRQYECKLDPCEIELMKGKYNLIAKKEGYSDENFNAYVFRNKTTEININFEYIPMIRKKSERFKLSLRDAVYNLRKTPLALSEGFAIRPLADSFSDLIISPNMKYAFFYGLDTEDEKNYHLDLGTKSLKRLNIGNIQAYTYAPRTDVMYFVRAEDPEDGNIVQTVNKFIPGNITPLANFVKTIKEPRIFVSEDENFVAVYDGVEGDIFLINTVENTREKVITLMGVRDIKFSPTDAKILIGTMLPDESEVLAYSIYNVLKDQLKDELLIASEPNSIVWRDEQNITYAVKEEYAPFGEGIAGLLENSILDVSFSRKSVVANYSLKLNKYTKIFESESFINRIDLIDKNTILFGDSEKVWEVKFGESR